MCNPIQIPVEPIYSPGYQQLTDSTMLYYTFLHSSKFTFSEDIMQTMEKNLNAYRYTRWPKSCNPKGRAGSTEIFHALEPTLGKHNAMLLATIQGTVCQK